MKPKKKPYEKPEVRSEDTLESATLACGKCLTSGPVGGSTPSCKQAKRMS